MEIRPIPGLGQEINGKLEMFLSPWKTKRLSKPTEVMLKEFKSQLKEVYAGDSLDTLNINNSNYKWTKTRHGCLNQRVHYDT